MSIKIKIQKYFKYGEKSGEDTEANLIPEIVGKNNEKSKKPWGTRLKDFRDGFLIRMDTPNKPKGKVAEIFTMDDLNNYKTIGERFKDLGGSIKSKFGSNIKKQNLVEDQDQPSDLEEDVTEGQNLKDKLKGLAEKLKIPKSKQEAVEVIQNAVENFKDLSPKDKAKMIGLGLAALGLSAVAIHAAIPVVLGSTVGGVAGTGFGTFTGLGMGQSVLGFGAIEGVKGVAVGTAATMAKVYAGGIAAGSVGGALVSTTNIIKKLSSKKEDLGENEINESEFIKSIENQLQSKKISPEEQIKIDKINSTPNISGSRKAFEIGEIVKNAPEVENLPSLTYENAQTQLKEIKQKQNEIYTRLRSLAYGHPDRSEIESELEDLNSAENRLDEFVKQKGQEAYDYIPNKNNIRIDLIKRCIDTLRFGDSEEIKMDIFDEEKINGEFAEYREAAFGKKYDCENAIFYLIAKKSRIEKVISNNRFPLLKNFRMKELVKINSDIIDNFAKLKSINNDLIAKTLEIQNAKIT